MNGEYDGDDLNCEDDEQATVEVLEQFRRLIKLRVKTRGSFYFFTVHYICYF